MKRWIPLVVVAFALSACGASASSSPASDAGAGTTASAASSTTAAESSPAPTVDGGNPLVAKDFCAFLDEVAPQVVSAGSSAGALATLSIALSTWIEGHPEQKPRYAQDMDDAALGTCPGSRQKILSALGKPSFDAAF